MSLRFVEAEGSWPRLQQPHTCTCPQPEISSPRQRSYFFKTRFNIILHPWLGLPSGFLGEHLILLEKKTVSLDTVFRGAHYIEIQGE